MALRNEVDLWSGGAHVEGVSLADGVVRGARWHDCPDTTGQSANALTPDSVTTLGHGGDFHDALVEVAKVGHDE